MSSNATTRRARPTKCVVCLRRPRRKEHPTCATCADRTNKRGRARYAERVAAEQCTRCGDPAEVVTIDGTRIVRTLCVPHRQARSGVPR